MRPVDRSWIGIFLYTLIDEVPVIKSENKNGKPGKVYTSKTLCYACHSDQHSVANCPYKSKSLAGKGAASKANVSACSHDATEASADSANSSVEPEAECSTCSTCDCENMRREGLTGNLLYEASVRGRF